jgi:F-BAR domain only protein
MITACESLADAHSTLSQKINSDVEKPLREYSSKNKEMSTVKSVQGNAAALAKDVDEAQKRSDKIMAKGNKADSTRLSAALSSVQEAQQQWESQAPYVFEQLQALDEQRVNHLRDVLTQYQTHQSDQLERSRVIVASSLEAILNVDTSEEISAFVARTSGSAPALPQSPPNARRMSRHSASSASRPTMGGSTDTPPVPEVPRTLTVPFAAGRRGSATSGAESRGQSAGRSLPN